MKKKILRVTKCFYSHLLHKGTDLFYSSNRGYFVNCFGGKLNYNAYESEASRKVEEPIMEVIKHFFLRILMENKS